MCQSKWSLETFKIIAYVGLINWEYASWKEEASIITVIFFLILLSSIGFPIFPPTWVFILFFFKICSISLQVVDLPLLPVTTIGFILGFKI
mgnify:CR=1 FL=1